MDRGWGLSTIVWPGCTEVVTRARVRASGAHGAACRAGSVRGAARLLTSRPPNVSFRLDFPYSYASLCLLLPRY
eukprot:COSAG01_NODE_300_length_19226_cov_41.536519_14_plen_74_part_00